MRPLPSTRLTDGFTLIEMSLVLVIIGLVIGSVLVGRELISAATVRSQISQIEKYQTAVNTFRAKYGYLPGDIPSPVATQYGFIARGTCSYEGDGDGSIAGIYDGSCNSGAGYYEGGGESAVFWVDLSASGLMDGSFNTADETHIPVTDISSTGLSLYFPPAKIGAGHYVYVWSKNSINYYGLSAVNMILSGHYLMSNGNLSIQNAFNVDNKMDDGLPQSGRVLAQYINSSMYPAWAGNGGWGAAPGIAAGPTATTCYDNGNNASAVMRYSVGYNAGTGANCGLSFQFQ